MVVVQTNIVESPYQTMPTLSEEEYQALKADIAHHGILVPIEIDEKGSILDGHHRVKAWEELKKEGIAVPQYTRVIRGGLTEAQKRNHSRCLNLLRRHLTKDQLKEQMIAMRQDGMTLPAIAEATHVDPKTVLNYTKDSDLEISKSEIVNTRGQKRPAKYKPRAPKTVIAFNDKEAEQILEEVAPAFDSMPDKTITAKRAGRIAREADAKERRETTATSTPHAQNATLNVDIRHGNFQKALDDIQSDSVDLIFTDPPYGKDYMNLWQDLGTFAQKVLKPGGFLITYSGQSHLDKVFSALTSQQLLYFWMIAQINTSSKKNIVHHTKIYSQWKPLILFTKSPISPLQWTNDVLNGSGMEKEWHDWQQSEGEALYCIDHFSPIDSLVVDPFVGGGTTARACKHLNRRFIGCDIDMACVSKTLERLNE